MTKKTFLDPLLNEVEIKIDNEVNVIRLLLINKIYTACFKDLVLDKEILILSLIFETAGEEVKIGLSVNPNPP